ncbi:MAG: amidophosphoribosyltransferase [Firmicutes bacterium]|nr:amidophosphoribosyltransferase [Bacillota bacterium]
MHDQRLVDDKFTEECGVFGIFGHPQAVEMAYYGLHALQHRGQESCGIAATDGQEFTVHKGLGLVTDVFTTDRLNKLQGDRIVGHVRHTTAWDNKITDAQPLVFKYRAGTFALAHNGNLVNASQIRRYLERQGSIFQTESDTEVIAHLMARSAYDQIDLALKEALSMIKGAYAIIVLTENQMIAALDPNGLRPFVLGKVDGAYCLASETCAFDVIGAEYIRDVQPGELIVIDQDGLQTGQFTRTAHQTLCSFEFIYFARPDSNINGINVHQSRKLLGEKLAKEHPVDADVVMGVPDSSISAAMGYAQATGLPYEVGLIKNRYVGRTFIKPSQRIRYEGVRMKLSVVRKVVEGKRIVIIDDSIVRGTTISRIVRMLKDAGAKEIHVRISSPPVAHPCYYGIDSSDREELIVAHKTLAEVCEYIGADSLEFLSVEGLREALLQEHGVNGLCLACFTGQYPTEIYPNENGVGKNG